MLTPASLPLSKPQNKLLRLSRPLSLPPFPPTRLFLLRLLQLWYLYVCAYYDDLGSPEKANNTGTLVGCKCSVSVSPSPQSFLLQRKPSIVSFFLCFNENTCRLQRRCSSSSIFFFVVALGLHPLATVQAPYLSLLFWEEADYCRHSI